MWNKIYDSRYFYVLADFEFILMGHLELFKSIEQWCSAVRSLFKEARNYMNHIMLNKFKIYVFFFMYCNITQGKNKHKTYPVTQILICIISEQTLINQGQEKLEPFNIIIYTHIHMLLHIEWIKLCVLHNWINVPNWLSQLESLKCDLQVTHLDIWLHSS